MANPTGEMDIREQLLRNVKKEVKQIMEEAVTRKFVHEDSSSVTSFCGAVELCLHHRLRKRALGLFKNSTTTALLQKIGKTFEPAARVVQLLKDFERNSENSQKLSDGRSPTWQRSSSNRFLWVRLALLDKQLTKIVDYLLHNASKYYEKDALMTEQVDGLILASLLVGPCSLEYSRMKIPDHYWTDPSADELVQRHRIHSGSSYRVLPATGGAIVGSPKRPGLQVRRYNNSSANEESQALVYAKDYVKSLHQNTRSALLYGKNNVVVQPTDDVEPLPGYLSLHQDSKLNIKWTPNQLMHGCSDDENGHSSIYWQFAVTICVDDIVYIHCHQQPTSGGTVVLVSQDGVQRSPLHFPKGGHLLAFLSCLENGLLPHGRLDPPLWNQRGKGKVFPRLKRKTSSLSGSVSSTGSSSTMSSQSSVISSVDGGLGQMMVEEEEATDFVFRVVTAFRPENLQETAEPKDCLNGIVDWPKEEDSGSSAGLFTEDLTESAVELYARAQELCNSNAVLTSAVHSRSAVKQLCDSMKCQILSRAFYGWLSHCRHMKTVRTHLAGLVLPDVIPRDDPRPAGDGLTNETWKFMSQSGSVIDEIEIYRLIYYGGCEHTIRPEVWPYLLSYYKFGSTQEEREELDRLWRQQYENTVSEWLAVEAIVQQQDKETMEANLVKLSCDQPERSVLLSHKDSTISNDVFESMQSDDLSVPETVPEENSEATSPTPDSKKPPPSGASMTQVRQVLEGEHQVLTAVRSNDSKGTISSTDDGLGDSVAHGSTSDSCSKCCDGSDAERDIAPIGSSVEGEPADSQHILITNPTLDMPDWIEHAIEASQIPDRSEAGCLRSEVAMVDSDVNASASNETLAPPTSPAVSNASNGGVYSPEFIETIAINIHRIDKDVQRCDRNYAYFTADNLEKLRNIVCTYVWENIDVGYIQGMCDLVAPLLVIFDDEAKTYGCFTQLMKRMSANFQLGGAMDQHFGNMRSLIQILDPELFEHMHQNGDFTHFYFCYRWFLLDFKRELLYSDVFKVWELIWVARRLSSTHFPLFFALALVEFYREIIIDNNMDFTDIIKFFNEMAERHDVKKVMQIARDLVARLQDLIQNK